MVISKLKELGRQSSVLGRLSPSVAEVRPLGLECAQRPDRQAELGAGVTDMQAELGAGVVEAVVGKDTEGSGQAETRPTHPTEADQSLANERHPNRHSET